MVNRFPGEANFPAQRALLRVIVEKGIYAKQTQPFVDVAAELITPDMDEEAIYQELQRIPILERLVVVRGDSVEQPGKNLAEIAVLKTQVEALKAALIANRAELRKLLAAPYRVIAIAQSALRKRLAYMWPKLTPQGFRFSRSEEELLPTT